MPRISFTCATAWSNGRRARDETAAPTARYPFGYQEPPVAQAALPVDDDGRGLRRRQCDCHVGCGRGREQGGPGADPPHGQPQCDHHRHEAGRRAECGELARAHEHLRSALRGRRAHRRHPQRGAHRAGEGHPQAGTFGASDHGVAGHGYHCLMVPSGAPSRPGRSGALR